MESFPEDENAAEQQETCLAADAVTGPARKRGWVLVVDDDPVNRELMWEVIKAAGYAAETAGNGAEALATLSQRRPALVLLDVHMPVMDGLEAVQRIRANESLAGLAVMALTASVDRATIEKCRKAGFDEILIKPVEFDRLFAILGNHLG